MKWLRSPKTTIFTALPTGLTSADDGREIRFLADASAGVIWHLRYRHFAADGVTLNASAYKWEWAGGSDIYSEVVTFEAVGTAFAGFTTPGPSVTVPLAGDYMVRIQARAQMDSPNAAAIMSFTVGGTAASFGDGGRGVTPNSRNDQGEGLTTFPGPVMIVGESKKTGLAAATALVSQGRREGVVSAGSIGNRRMWVRPVRVG